MFRSMEVSSGGVCGLCLISAFIYSLTFIIDSPPSAKRRCDLSQRGMCSLFFVVFCFFVSIFLLLLFFCLFVCFVFFCVCACLVVLV